MRVAVLAGGVGAARFLEGLVQAVEPSSVTAIVNTGDDAEFYGLHICPDLDTVMYTLAGLVDPETGWGVERDTIACQQLLARYGAESWFRLGDRDLATHIRRTELLRGGMSLSAVTDVLREALGVHVHLVPMTDDPVRTHISTPNGVLAFQEYFVRRGQQDEVLGITFEGLETAQPAPGVLEAIAEADVLVIAPSNPFVSVGPILAIAGVRDTIVARRDVAVAISPIIGGAA
ncbi:MAG: 2-phospho-L-lactate transferase, partial [Chloroflexota bacterium]|nr:2-phospho-L-lactate transferase [Chloroflexota bacterium]